MTKKLEDIISGSETFEEAKEGIEQFMKEAFKNLGMTNEQFEASKVYVNDQMKQEKVMSEEKEKELTEEEIEEAKKNKVDKTIREKFNLKDSVKILME